MSFRDYLDPGGSVLASRLEQLCSTFENLATRLRATIVHAIGETIGGIVRDTALRVLQEVAHYLPSPVVSSTNTRSKDRPDQHEEHADRNYWDDLETRDRIDAREESTRSPTPERLPTALSAGLQACAWWLRRWSGQGRMLTTLAVGLLATGMAFVGGPWVIAALGLAESATEFTNLVEPLAAHNSGPHSDCYY